MIGLGKGRLSAVVVLCLVCVACGMGVAGRPAPRSVTFQSSDNTLLAATYYPVDNAAPPGLILVHGERGNRKDWAPWALRAQRQGIATIAVDLRGHGQSDRPEAWPTDPAAWTRDQWRQTPADILAAKNFLLTNGVDPATVVLVGVGIGANLAGLYMYADPSITAAVLVSPGLDYNGIKLEEAIRNLGHRPLMLMASEQDAYARDSCVKLRTMAPGHCESRIYPGGAHGIDLLASSPSAFEQILLWIEPIVAGRHAAADTTE